VSALPATREPEGTIPCPRCDAAVGPDQAWCLLCGTAARTRLVPTPNWRAPIVVLALIAVLAGLVLALAFVSLTNDSEPAAPANSQAPSPANGAGAPQPSTATPPPAATTPPPSATTTAPPTTTGATPTTTPSTGTTATGTTATGTTSTSTGTTSTGTAAPGG
jgi:hypothetical protein